MSYIEGISIGNEDDAELEFEDGLIYVRYLGKRVEFTPTAYQLRKLADWCDQTANDMED